jgi:TonB family protein
MIATGGSMSRLRIVSAFSALFVALLVSGAAGARAFPLQRQAQVYETGPEIVPPTVVRSVKPTYTRAAMREKIQGTLEVAAVVKADGSVSDLVVTQSLDTEHGLDEEGLKAVRQWQFTPGTRNGQPVNVRVRIELRFTLK